MKITIESTDRIVEIRASPGAEPVPARLWEGETDTGLPVECLVTRIAARRYLDLAQFERELLPQRPPRSGEAFPLRLIL